MSYSDGMAAINLDKPARVPRTEYSACAYWELVETVTGIHADPGSPQDVRETAQAAFRRAWNYDFCFATGLNPDFGPWRTKMGHAEYASQGSDFSTEISCPFDSPEEVLAFDPFEKLENLDHKTLVDKANAAWRHNRERFPEEVSTVGIYQSLVSGFIDLFGWDMLLMAAGTDLEAFGRLADRYAQWLLPRWQALADCEAPVILCHDDMVWTSGPIFNPTFYREHIFPNFARYWAPVLEAGKKLAFCSDGCYTMFVDDLVKAGASGFVMEPLTDMAYIAEHYGRTHFFIGNADTRILLSGTKEAIRAEVARCMDIGKDCPGFFMAVGNHIPSNTPIENALYYNECYVEMGKR